MRSALRAFASRLKGLFTSRITDSDFAQELDSHLHLLIDDNIARGMSPTEAARAARLKLGNPAQLRESHHDQRTVRWFESLLQDTRFAGRMLGKNPGFTAVAVLTLALGVGANTAIFTAYNAVALKPLPISDPAHVVRLERWVRSGSLGSFQYGFSYPEYAYCRDHADTFSALVAASWVTPVRGSLSHSTAPERLQGQLVSANYFTDLGIRPQVGRAFVRPEDLTPGSNPVIVISYRFWQRALQGSQDVLGQAITVGSAQLTIIGVTPKAFTGTSLNPQVPDFWAPLSMQAQLLPGQDWLHQPNQHVFQIFGRLKSSANRSSAQAQTDLLIRQYVGTYTETDSTTAVTLQRTTYFPNTDDIRFRALVATAMLIVGLILFVACANVGNMLLARGAARQREICTRRALGASRQRIVRQLLTESLLLSSLGGIAGLIVCVWTMDLLQRALQRAAALVGGDFSAVNFVPDVHVMAYTLAISLCAGIVLGLSPALQFVKQDLASALKDETSSLGKLSGPRVRGLMVAGQVGVSMFLLATAGLFARGLIRSQAADPGFDTRGVFVLVGNFGDSHGDPAVTLAAQKRLIPSLADRAEFAAVALGGIPFAGTWTPPMTTHDVSDRTLATYVSDTYMGALGVSLLRGRNFTSEEANDSAPLALVSQSAAQHFWPTGDAIGKSFALDMNFHGKLSNFQVIGVVRDIRFANLTRIDPAHVYLAGTPAKAGGQEQILARIHGDPKAALAAAQEAARSLQKNSSPDLQLISFDENFVSLQRMMSQVLAMFAATLALLALALAGAGVYGVLGYLVSQRTREIGVRMALGADRRAILKSIVLTGLRPVLAGMLFGLAAAAALSCLLHQTLLFPGSMDFLYGVRFYDPATFAVLSCFVLGVAALASAVPALGALRVDPMVALRHE